MQTDHRFAISTEWIGNRGHGTTGYRDYDRTSVVSGAGKPAIPSSSDRTFFGESDRWNPEELLLAALSECHLLSYLHVAAVNGVVVTAYSDDATATLELDRSGGGRMTSATLRPRVTVADGSMRERAQELHHEASAACFIRASVSFPVDHIPTVEVS